MMGVMKTNRRRIVSLGLAAVVLSGLGACAQPEANPAIKVTGDPTKAMPPRSTTTTSTTTAVPTTLFYK
jgi:hypothetical protein